MDDDFDTPWKEVVTQHFPEFMAFYFPQAHAAIDWSRPHDFLDQEFAALTRDAELGKRVLDKLVRVHLHTGGEQWVLVHLEIQGRHDTDFAERIFVYNYRVYDRYRRPVASLALLTDASKRWRPCAFSYQLLGCEMRIDFPIVKLQDYADRVDELLMLDNPFALVTVAHLLTQQTKGNAHRRRIAKWHLTKQLYQRNWDRQRIINLYRVIDWIMSLPKELDARLHEGIVQWERRNAMTYLSSIERIGMEIGMKKGEELGWRKGLEEGRQAGRQEGRQEGRREALLEMLTILLTERFGKLDAMSSAILTVADVDQLTAWSKNVLGARSLSEVFADK
jgi:predicted transposase YdaD